MLRLCLILGFLLGTAAGAKVTTFSVCAKAYGDNVDTGSFSSGTDLYTCDANGQATNAKVGSVSVIGGNVGGEATGQNLNHVSIRIFQINGCLISNTGVVHRAVSLASAPEPVVDIFQVAKATTNGKCYLKSGYIKELAIATTPDPDNAGWNAAKWTFNLNQAVTAPVSS